MHETFFECAAWGDNFTVVFRFEYNFFLSVIAIVTKYELPNFFLNFRKISNNLF